MNKMMLYFFVSTVLLQGCSDPAERVLGYLDSGKEFYKQENYPKAKVEFKNALQIDNNLADAYYHLALIDEKDQSWKRMFANLNRTIKLDPENNEARLKLAKLFLLSGEVERARAGVDLVLGRMPSNIEAIALNGAIFLKQGDSEAALREADKALAIDSEFFEGIGLKVVAYMNVKDFSKGEAVVNHALVTSPNELSLNLLKLQLHLVSNDDLAIEQDYKTLIKRFPKNLKFSFLLAQFYIIKQRDQDALILLQAVVEKNPDLLGPKIVLVDFLIQKDKPQAEKVLKTFIENSADKTDLYFRLANLQFQSNKVESAKQSLAWIIDNNQESKQGLAAKILLVRLALQEKNKELAFTLLAEALTIDAKYYDAMLLQAQMILLDKKYDEGISKLRAVLRDYPRSDKAMVLLARAYLKKESPELAEEYLRKAASINPGNFSAVMPVASLMINVEDYTRAEELLQKALKTNPNHAAALQALAQVRLLKKDWQGTQDIAEQIANQPKGESYSYYLKGKVAQEQGEFKEAIKQYKKALLIGPGLTDALKRLAVCHEALKQRSQMMVYLDEFMLKNPKNSYSVFIKAQLFSFNKDWKNALKLLNKGVEQWPKVPDFYELMAGIYKAKKDIPNAIGSYKKGLENNPNNVKLSLLLTAAYTSDKQYDNALAVYESLIAVNPKADVVANNFASLLLDHYPGKENTQKAVELSKRFAKSEQPFFLDTYGWALLLNGDTTESLEYLLNATSKMPGMAIFQYHLGVAQHKNNNITQAISALEKAISSKSSNFIEKEQAEALLLTLKVSLEVN